MARPVPGSFRDPSGQVFLREGVLYRQVNHAYRGDYEELLRSGLYQALVERRLLVPHQEDHQAQPLSGEAYKVLRPERIDFISYPYEWCFSQLREAALATLCVQKLALEHDMSLRDASAYNIQFRGGRPVLIDTLSFERLPEGQPWVAYRQFCQHFLAPLALMAYRDLRLGRLLRLYPDGVPLDLATPLLPWRSRWRPSLLLHLHGHARSQRRHAHRPASGKGRFGRRALQGLVESLEAAVRRLRPKAAPSEWADYYATGDSYTSGGLAHKQELVGGFLAEVEPRSVWDLGANTGMFSRIASSAGFPTVAFDADPASVEIMYRRVVEEGEVHLLPLVMDLTNPSPGLGWASEERTGMVERGPVDLVMALALVHHLAIGNNVPLAEVAGFFRRLAEWLIVEFVPKSDPKVELLLASRQDVFPHYTQEGFEQAFAAHFGLERKEPIKESERVLYLMRGRG
ncbi:MAG: SAM-dependent methyltransferase [Actinomycetota bacterium]|nr:SAM-dependent methyltransferase [Actinomycetota bacterium]